LQKVHSQVGSFLQTQATFKDVEISSSPQSKKKEAEQDLAKKVVHQIAKSWETTVVEQPTPSLNHSQTLINYRSKLNEYCQRNGLSFHVDYDETGKYFFGSGYYDQHSENLIFA
jgi:dsRNA-specific ribonuclease